MGGRGRPGVAAAVGGGCGVSVWTREQWTAFCTILNDSWPGKMPASVFTSWRVMLDDVDPGEAVSAVKRLAFAGARFRPSLAELLSELRRDPSVPTFDEAFHLVFRRGGATRARELAEWRSNVHPLVASFVDRQGIERLRLLPVDDPEWGERHRRDLREAWERHVEAFDGREVAALASGDRRAPVRLDPLAAVRRIGAGDAGR